MRALVVCLVLAACATASSFTPPQRVAGCWINRSVGVSRMHWREADATGAVQGTKTTFGIGGANSVEHFSLEGADSGWRLCRTDGDAHCWDVAQGEGGSLAGGRAFIDRSGDSLRIAVIGDGSERVIFQGVREACRN